MDRHGQVTAPFFDLALPPREAVEQTLRASARMQTDQAHPLGCLVVLSTTIPSPESRPLQALLAAERQRSRAGLRTCVHRAIATGELQAGTDADVLAAVFGTFLVGLATQARDSVLIKALGAGISELIQVWDAAGLPA